ncbi:MAG: phytanoyl-CoA dioxygenase family protein [Bacteroidia bacterium]|nr:phytanoyl-CoA dioxygenase family protein [Bacteroidia bacterium]
MLNWLRTFKASYVLNNLLNRSKIAHNKPLFQKYNIKRPLSWPINSTVFSHLPQPRPWIDEIKTLDELKAHPNFLKMTHSHQEHAIHWFEKGYLIFREFFNQEEVEEINAEVASLLSKGNVNQRKNNKIFFAYRHSDLLGKLVRRKELVDLMSALTGKRMLPFQSLNFIKGSQQRAHSDSIHMTTYPMGYLTAIWIALEKVDDASGPLFYYPGSHRLPYVMNHDFEHGGNRYQIGSQANAHYEDKIEEVIQANNFEKAYFYTEPGDLLIWHANLIHGGDPIRDKSRTRKSMVVHYFGEDVICYHELTQRLALMPTAEYH